MSRPALLLVLSSLILVGCGPQTYSMRTQYYPSEIVWSKGKGSGEIDGSAVIRQSGGGVVTCAGNVVNATPVSSYAEERMLAIYDSATRGYRPAYSPLTFEQTDARYLRDSHETVCDAQGFFSFSDLASGDYFITTAIVWYVGYGTEGGSLMRRVSVVEGDKTKIVLTP